MENMEKRSGCVWRREKLGMIRQKKESERVDLTWWEGRKENSKIQDWHDEMMRWWSLIWKTHRCHSLLRSYRNKTPLKCNTHSHILIHIHSLTLTDEIRICNPKGTCCYLRLLLCVPSLHCVKTQILGPTTHYLKTLFLRMPCIDYHQKY